MLEALKNFPGKKNFVIISETDLLGNIVSANESFCAVSGYSRDELVGKPHNIIRHPSMPKELFQKLWSTIQQGDVFRAVIKNSTKNGNHYWVNATIMPVFSGREIIRYVGGRHVIEDENLAEELFKKQMSTFKTIGNSDSIR
jgi:methyl-accepting chemotaxis protein